MSLSELEKKGALQIILYLFKKGNATRTDLRKNIKAVMETIYSSLDVLKRLGLVEDEETRKFPFTRRVYLTEKGTIVAKRLIEIEDILKTKE